GFQGTARPVHGHGMPIVRRHCRDRSAQDPARPRQGACRADGGAVRRLPRPARVYLAAWGQPQSIAAHGDRARSAPARHDGCIAQRRVPQAMTLLETVLDLARWAPSGDNTQPWRFAIEADDRVAVYGHDTRLHSGYDLDG